MQKHSHELDSREKHTGTNNSPPYCERQGMVARDGGRDSLSHELTSGFPREAALELAPEESMKFHKEEMRMRNFWAYNRI